MAPSSNQNLARVMPDVANEVQPAIAGVLDWVGMGDMEMPVSVADANGRVVTSGARVNAFVNLKRPDVRGTSHAVGVGREFRFETQCRFDRIEVARLPLRFVVRHHRFGEEFVHRRPERVEAEGVPDHCSEGDEE